MSVGSLILALGFIVGIGLIVGWPLITNAKEKRVIEKRDLTPLQAQYDAVVMSLRDLDFDFQTGKLLEADYQLQRERFMQIGADLLGSRFIETEVAAYFKLAAVQSATPPPLSPRSLTALTYALCGFVHVASMGIFVGGISALVPRRAKDISLLGLRALWTAFLTTLLTGCIAGVLSF